MPYRFAVLFVVVVALMAGTVTLASCSSSGDVKPDEEHVEALEGPDVTDAYQLGKEWLPGDAMVVVSASGESIWEMLGEDLLPMSNPEADPGELGTVEGVREDLKNIVAGELGFDPTEADKVVAAASLERTVVVLFGDIDEPDGSAVDTIAGTDVYELGHPMPAVQMGPGQGATAAMIEEPRRGVVISSEPAFVGQLLEARNGGDDAENLAGAAMGDEYARLFEEVEGSRIAVAGAPGPVAGLAADQMPLPDSAVAGGSTTAMKATIEGSDETLYQISELVEQSLQVAHDEFDAVYDDAQPGTVDRLAAIYTRHLMAALDDQLQSSPEDGQLRFDVQLSGSPTTFAMVAGVGAALAIPAFYTYQQRARFAEAEGTMSRMADGARAYFEGDQQFSREDGVEPWHVADEDADYRPGQPVPFDKKTFPGGPEIKVVSSPEVPSGGDSVSYEPETVKGDINAQLVFDALGIHQMEQQRFRYVFETGSGTGSDATATIRAEANFNPDSPHNHTVIQELEVGEHMGAVVIPMYTKHEGE